jgi:hypothetical protein
MADFAYQTLRRGAPPDYALPELIAARRKAPSEPSLRALHAVYLARLGRAEEAATLVKDDSALFPLLRAVSEGTARAGSLAVPRPRLSRPVAAPAAPEPVSLIVYLPGPDGARATLASALTQEHPAVEVVLAGRRDALDATAGLEFGDRLRRVEAGSLAAGLRLAALDARHAMLGFVIAPDRLFPHHVLLLLSHLADEGVEAVASSGLDPAGAGVVEASRQTRGPALPPSLSCILARRRYLEGVGLPKDGPDREAGLDYLRRVSASHALRNVAAATVLLGERAEPGRALSDESELRRRLDPVELYREIVAAGTREAMLRKRIEDLERSFGRIG